MKTRRCTSSLAWFKMYVVVRGNYILDGRCWIGDDYYSIYDLPKLGCMTRVVWYEEYDENLLKPEE